WRRCMEGLPPALELPSDRPRPAVQTHRGRSLTAFIGAESTARLQAFSRRQGASLFMTLLAAFQTLLFRYTGQQDFVVGTPVAGRNRIEIEDLIGFFVNMLVLRADLGGEPGFGELLGRVREMTL